MKIVQYMLGFRNKDGGVVRALIDLCNHLAKRGHEVIAQTTDAVDAPTDWDGREGRPLLRVLSFNKFVPALISGAAKNQARRDFAEADIVHLHVPWDPICIQLARLARRMNIPYILTVHGMLDDWTMAHRAMKKKMYLAMGGRRMLEHAACVQCCAQVELKQSAKWYPHGRSKVVPLLFDLAPFEKLPGPELARRKFSQAFGAGEPAVLYVGRLHSIKRIEMLLDAAEQLGREGLQCRVLLVGSGDAAYEQQLRDEVQKKGLSDRVSFLGFVTGDEKISLYQAADVAVHPSAHENFGYVTVEALACGTPVITTKAVNIWPELQASGGAVIVDASSSAIAGALNSLLKDQSMNGRTRLQMGSNGREWVIANLNPERVVGQYESMYREAIERGTGG